ncbi:MAG TPA: V-type ATP synthase subunit A [Spirochaetota bacterium]|nr:V-type ATP synthase subunit A [Spirochaetota bacterium]HOL56022.1 V-type ATP synthase subunit A [Spirochaetota bacterium]
MSVKGKITGIVSNLISIEVDGPVSQNEICYVIIENSKLMSEVIKIVGNIAYAQVFESTRTVKVGMPVEFTGNMLEIELGPGLLSKNFDGLQNDLDKKTGIFLKKGEYTEALDRNIKYKFTPLVKKGDIVIAGDWLGSVKENWIDHKIMVPFKLNGKWEVKDIVNNGEYTITDKIATLVNENKEEVSVTMVQKWPVKVAIKCYKDKPRPFKIMETGVRIIDTFNPMAEGGTGFIPGPFGCGKTVLQHAISKNAEADLIIFAACGERANEVVEIFTEFPELIDPRTGRKLMERTTIICNTSNMPVAAREASVYTAMTIGEYYRQMGLKVLLLADSTSRWAQALREMSNRLEELPGPDAFPMDLPAIISNFYSRAGIVYLNNGQTGSVTFIGTVSPAGGNLKEPVTESTKKAARCFYALAQSRADSKRYPAVDPIDSYSKYLEYPEIQEYLSKNVGQEWVGNVFKAKNWTLRGKEAYDQINILGDDGVPVDYHITYWKSEVIDFVLMQQDAFDKIDSITPLARQRYMLNLVIKICESDYKFESFEKVSQYFKRIINVLKQMNYSEFESENFKSFEKELELILDERRVK